MQSGTYAVTVTYKSRNNVDVRMMHTATHTRCSRGAASCSATSLIWGAAGPPPVHPQCIESGGEHS